MKRKSNAMKPMIIIAPILAFFVFLTLNSLSNSAKEVEVFEIDEAGDSLYLASTNSETLYSGRNATDALGKALASISNGDRLTIHKGTFRLTFPLSLVAENVKVQGDGMGTVLDFSSIGDKHAVRMSNDSTLSNLKIIGSIIPLPRDLSQKILTNHNTVVSNVSLSQMGYGFEIDGKNNVTLENISCELIRSRSGWAACIHGGSDASAHSTSDVKVNMFNITNSDRAIELDAISRNVTVENGIMYSIENTNNHKSEPFSLDTHSHDGEGRNLNITFRNVLIIDSYAPSAKIASQGKYALGDTPLNILFDNITVLNPTSAWQINGENLTIKNSLVKNVRFQNAMTLFKNSTNILIQNSTVEELGGENFFIANNETGVPNEITNLTISDNTINNTDSKKKSVLMLYDINNLKIQNNTVIDAPLSKPWNLTEINSSVICDNRIGFINGSIIDSDEPCT